jgi:plasmid stabilization system protein ParE
MSLRVVFKLRAQTEYTEAASWYERQRENLGREFTVEIENSLNRARANPEHFPKVYREARKIQLRRFSRYNIYFVIDGDELSVLAVFHSSRNPEQLRQRLR